MKRIFLLGITLMVSAAMLMTACKKDNPQPDNGGNDTPTPTPTEVAANTMVLNGTTYHLNCHYSIDVNGRSYAGAETVELDAENNPLFTIIADVEQNTLNQTYTFPLPTTGEEVVYWSIHDLNWDFEMGPDLESGTLTISRTDDFFTYKVNGKTGDKTISFHISVPASEWELR